MTFDRTEHEVLVCCARTVLNSEIAARLAGLLRQEIDWDQLLRMAVDHGTVPLLYRHLQAIGQDAVPDESLSQLRDHFNKNVRHNLFLTGELIKVLDLFEAHQVTAIPFKGPTLAGCAYGNLALRKFNDLDLLIFERDVPKAKKLLLGEGYRLQFRLTAAQETAYLRTICQLPLVRDDGGFVELHTRITPRDFAFDMPVQQLVERLVPVCVAGKQLRTFSPEDLLLVLCVHGAKHLWGCLGRICDVAELIRTHPGIQWDEVLDQARRLHVERMLFLGLSLARGLLESPVPEPVLQRTDADLVVPSLAAQVRERLFREQGASISGLESSLFHLKARERLRDGLRYCLSLAMTPTVSDWTAISLPRCLFPFYPLLRLGRLVRKYGSRLTHKMTSTKPKEVVEPVVSATTCTRKHPRRWRRFAVVVGILVLVYVFRASLLSGVAGGLVVNESNEPADWALVLGGDRCYEEAARLHHEGMVGGILLIEFAPSRLVRIGVLPSDEELARRALNIHELPETTIDLVRDEAKSMWEAARHLDEWMTQHPGHRLRVLCPRFAGREQRWLFSRVLGADRAACLSWHPLRDRRYDETSWWHRKEGVLDVFNSYVSLGYVWLNGEQPSTRHEWDAEEWLAAALEGDDETTNGLAH